MIMKIKSMLLLLLWGLMVCKSSAYKLQSIDITVDGQKRNILCYTPNTVSANMPLWIVTHGMNQNPEYQRDGDHLYELIDTEKFIVCYLRSDGNTWDIGGQKDLNFVRQTIKEMATKYGINKNRVYWSGFSMGSMLIYHGIENGMGDIIAAFAPCSGIKFGEPWKNCKKPINLIHCHGKGDDVFPLDQYDPRGYAYHFVELDKCANYKKTENYRPQGAYDPGTKEVWTDGLNGTEVEILLCENHGHWPSVNYTREYWNFCKRFSLAEGPKVKSVTPEDGAFDMDPALHREFRVELDKAVDLTALKATLNRAYATTSIKLQATAENEGKTLVLTIPGTTKPTKADWKLTLENLMSADGGMSPVFTSTYTYGEQEVNGEELVTDTAYVANWDLQQDIAGEGIPRGWKCIITDKDGKKQTKTYKDSIPEKASHLVYYPSEGDFNTGFLLQPFTNQRVELVTGQETTTRAKLKAGKYNIRFRSIYYNNRSRTNKVGFNLSMIGTDADKTVALDQKNITSKNYQRTGQDFVSGSIEHEIQVEIPKYYNYDLSLSMEHEVITANNTDAILISTPVITAVPSNAELYKGGFLRAMKQAKDLMAMQDVLAPELASSLEALESVIAQYEGLTSILPSEYTTATNALQEAMSPILAVGLHGVTLSARESSSPSSLYDLQGRRLTAPVQRGVYVRDGKKVLK